MSHVERLIAGLPAEVRAIDVRAFAHREECAAATSESGATLDLWCVHDLESRVDRDELLRAGSTVEPPYWALPWIGARAIAAHVLACAPPPATSVLDLGCGLGLSGVAAARTGAHVTFADCVDEALAFAAASAALNRARGYAAVRLDFTRDRLVRTYDTILAADVVYDPAAYAPLVDFLDTHLARDGLLLLTETLRADARAVIERLARAGIAGARHGVWVLEDGRAERTWLHELRRT